MLAQVRAPVLVLVLVLELVLVLVLVMVMEEVLEQLPALERLPALGPESVLVRGLVLQEKWHRPHLWLEPAATVLNATNP